MATKISDSMLIIGPVRFSYMNVFRSRANKLRQGEKFFETVILIPKEPNQFCPDPTADLKAIADAIKHVAAEKFGADVKKFVRPLRDGDVAEDGEEPRHPGCWFMSTRSPEAYPPILLNGDQTKATEEMGWVSGDWGKVKLSFFAYDAQGKKGVSTSLRAVQFLYKDEPFGASSDPVAVAGEFGSVGNAHSPGMGAQAQQSPSGDEDQGGYNPYDDE